MGDGKKNQKSTPNPARNLKKDQLGGVVFGCTDSTINECLSKQLFGLPAQHFLYVRNIDPGLPLFLFNYSKRALHGVFEAVSSGQMNINPYGWTNDGSEKTSYPAQVQVRIQKNCRPLLENQFRPIIEGNYFTHSHFRFELDHVQVSKLLSLYSAQVIPSSASDTQSPGNWKALNTRARKQPYVQGGSTPSIMSNGHREVLQPLGDHVQAMGENGMDLFHDKFQKSAVISGLSDQNSASFLHELSDIDTNTMHIKAGGPQEKHIPQVENAKDSASSLTDYPDMLAKLMLEVQELTAFKQESLEKMGQLERMLHKLQSEVWQSQSHDRAIPVSLPENGDAFLDGTVMELYRDKHMDSDDIVYLAGGYNGNSWLASLESYSPSRDMVKSLCPMSSVCSYASLARLNGDIFVIGGGHGGFWYNTVECYSPVKNGWTSLACLSEMKGSLASVTLHEKIYAMGGGNGVKSFSDVEMLDLDVGRWISARSMLQKRFALAAVELNGAVYAVGGFDGEDYLSSAERFDPREYSWSRVGSMTSKRGCHSLVAFNEKLYAFGGFDGRAIVASVEVFDPRVGTWMTDAPMNYERGYASAAVLNNSIYAIGGLDGCNSVIDKVECYQEGLGWQVTDLKALGQRCFAAALV